MGFAGCFGKAWKIAMNSSFVKVKRKSLLAMIFIAYKNFPGSFRQQRDLFTSERELLLLSFTGTLILFMANVPVQIIRSSAMEEIDLRIYIGLIAFVSFFFIPLFLYIISTFLFQKFIPPCNT